MGTPIRKELKKCSEVFDFEFQNQTGEGGREREKAVKYLEPRPISSSYKHGSDKERETRLQRLFWKTELVLSTATLARSITLYMVTLVYSSQIQF